MKRTIAVAALLALVAVACGGETTETTTGGSAGTEVPTTETSATDTPPSASASFSVGIVEPFAIDPVNVADNQAFQVTRLVFDGLTDIDTNLEVVPAVAESWDSTDNVVWTFHLRDDVTFSNGRTVTAADFVFAWNRVANPESASEVAYHGLPIQGWGDVMFGDTTEISGIRAVDDTTLEVTLEEPFVFLPKVLAHPVFSPVPAEELESEEMAAAFADQPIGNGPYQLSGPWEHNVSIPLERHEGYYGTPGVADGIEFRIYSGSDPMYRDVQAGNLDIGFQAVSPAVLSSAQAEFGDRLLQVPVGATNYLGVPTNTPPFDNPDIRRALSMAIDREAIAERIHEGSVTPAKGLVPPQALGSLADACEGYCDFDPDGATALFDAAGGIPDGPILLYYPAGVGFDDEVEVIANGWRTTLGVEVELAADEFAPFIDQLYAGVDDRFYYISWIWDYPSAYSFLSPLLESTSGDNVGFWVNDEFDARLAEARTAATEEAGLPALEAAQRISGTELPLIPTTFATDLSVFGDRIGNLSETAYGVLYLENVTVSE